MTGTYGHWQKTLMVSVFNEFTSGFSLAIIAYHFDLDLEDVNEILDDVMEITGVF